MSSTPEVDAGATAPTIAASTSTSGDTVTASGAGAEAAAVAVVDVRAAHAAGDAGASRVLHDAKAAAATRGAANVEAHGGVGSGNIKSIVFGGLDGIITTFSTIASVAGGALPVQTVITLTLANLIADGIAMGLGDGLSSQAEVNFQLAERAREAWEFENHPEGEIDEMVTILTGKGFELEDARTIIRTMATPEHKDFFVDFMMSEELDLEVPDDPWGPVKDGAYTFGSFILFGAIPLLIYVFCYAGGYDNRGGIFGIAAASAVLTLFALGALQGVITRQPVLRCGLYTMVNGSLAAAAAYAVSVAILHIIGTGTVAC